MNTTATEAPETATRDAIEAAATLEAVRLGFSHGLEACDWLERSDPSNVPISARAVLVWQGDKPAIALHARWIDRQGRECAAGPFVVGVDRPRVAFMRAADGLRARVVASVRGGDVIDFKAARTPGGRWPVVHAFP